jgi:DNA-directed RNA polymerase alpha subunit
MRNFGKKSLDEMKERLRMRGFILPESEDSALVEDVEDVEEEDQFDDLPPEEA